MFCPTCGGSNPSDARFCMFCATPITPEAPAVQPTAVTGPTVRLGTPPPDTTPAAPQPMPSPRRQRRHANHDKGSMLFLVGLALLFTTGKFWPGILLLIGVMALLNNGGRGRQRDSMQGLVFFGGLALLFITGLWWPGVLLWLGALSLVGTPHHRWRCW